MDKTQLLAYLTGIIVSILLWLIPTALAQTSETVVPQEIPVVTGELVDNPIITPEALVGIFATEYGVNERLARRIISCESGWVRTAENPTSSASGYFQFLDSTWRSTMIQMGLPLSTSKTDPIISLKAGMYLLSQSGTSPWLSSESCWN